MDLKALSSICEGKKQHIVDSSRGKEERESLSSLFSHKKLSVEKVSQQQRINDCKKTIQTLEEQLSKQAGVIKDLRKRVKDGEDKVAEFQDLANTFKNEKEAAESKLLDLSKDLEEARSLETPFTVEYNSSTKLLKLGKEEREDVSYEDFSTLLSTLGVVLPDVKVKLTVEKVESKASEIKDSVLSLLTKVTDTQAEEIKKAATAIREYIDTFSEENLKQVKVESLPPNLQHLTKVIQRDGYLDQDTYDEYVPGAKEELSTAGAGSVPFIILKDSMERNMSKFKEKLKSLGVYDSVWKRIPGTPSKARISDTKSLYGFKSPTVIKEGKVYVIFE